MFSSPRRAKYSPKNQHRATCDGCGWRYFKGDRYKCGICADYDLCQACYGRGVHLDTNHMFRKIKAPGAKPEDVGLRHAADPHHDEPSSESVKTSKVAISAEEIGASMEKAFAIVPASSLVVEKEDADSSHSSEKQPQKGRYIAEYKEPLATRKLDIFVAKKKERGLLARLLGPSSSTVALRLSAPVNEKPVVNFDIHPEDCVIVVMGPTGAGKSTFISIAAGNDGVGIGHTLTSFTTTINTTRLPTGGDNGALAALGDAKVVLVDTPGFDDTNKPDYEIFEMIAQWLKKAFLSKVGIAGLIYLHRITDQRMAGAPLKNLEMFRKLCGNKMMINVTLMTTMWSEALHEEATRRERELRTKYFKEFLRRGATLAKFGDDQVSAVEILQPLVAAWQSRQEENRLFTMVRLQKELTTYNLAVEETSAARVVRGKVQAILEMRQGLLDNLASRLEASTENPELVQESMSEMARLQSELEEAQREADRLHLAFASQLKVFSAKMRRIQHPLLNMARKKVLSDPLKSTATSSRRYICEVEREAVQSEDRLVIVAGLTGSGISTFVSKAVGEDVGIGPQESYYSYTQDIKLFRTPYAKFVLADTPGFDNYNEEELENKIIRERIADLVHALSQTAHLYGFIFLYRADRLFEFKKLLTLIDFLAPVFALTAMSNVVIAIREGEDGKFPDGDVLARLRKELEGLPCPLKVDMFEGGEKSAKDIVEKYFRDALPFPEKVDLQNVALERSEPPSPPLNHPPKGPKAVLPRSRRSTLSLKLFGNTPRV